MVFFIKKRRYNKEFFKYYNFYISKNKIETDFNQLKIFIKKAEEAPFWKKQFKKYKVDSDSKDLETELAKLPVLNKQTVIENFDDINIEKIDENKRIVYTSGSTGAPLAFYETQSMENKQWAVWWRYRNYHNIKLNTWCAWFGGKTIMNVDRKKPPYWHINFFNKQIMFSAHHLSIDTVEFYHKKIKQSKVFWIHGYPSQISYLASLIAQKRLTNLKNIKIITLGAENLMGFQEELIKKVFNAKIVQHYGLAEGVANISQNRNGDFVIDKDFAMVKFLPVKNKENLCKIIGTNYNNLAFPLINYDTGDLVSLKKIRNSFEIISIDGRNEDFVILPNGIKLGRLDHIFKKTKNIIESQIYQKQDYTIVLRVVKTKIFSKSDELNLLEEARKRFGNIINIEIEYLEKIKRKKSGKIKFVISEIKK